MKVKRLVPCIALLLVVGAHDARAQYLHPRLTSRQAQIRTVLVLPAQAELNRSGMKGSEGMTKEAGELSDQLFALVVKELEARKLEVVSNSFGGEQPEDAKYEVANLQSKYDTLLVQLRKKPKDVRKGRFSMGDAVAGFGPAGASDAIVFVRGAGAVLTGGKKAFGWIVAGPKFSGFSGDLAFVCARSGDILAFTQFRTSGDVVKTPEQALRPTLQKSLKKVPLGVPAPAR